MSRLAEAVQKAARRPDCQPPVRGRDPQPARRHRVADRSPGQLPPSTAKWFNKPMTQQNPRWDRGDGKPDLEQLDRVTTGILDACRPHRPVEIVLFGSGARGELRPTSDLDLMVVLPENTRGSLNPRRIALEIENGRQPRVEIVVAFENEVKAAGRSLVSVLRTAREEGVTVFWRGRRLPYLRRPRPHPVREIEDAGTAADEAGELRRNASERLGCSERRAKRMTPENPCLDMTTTMVAGAARKAIELSLQAAIVDLGRRPRAWKDPAALVAEATAAGARLPEVDRDALSRAGNHYPGNPYPGYPHPTIEEAAEALELARAIVPGMTGDTDGTDENT